MSVTGVGVHAGEGEALGGSTSSRLGDRLFGGAAKAAGWVIVLLVLGVGGFLLAQAVPSLLDNNANFLTDRVWSVSGTDLQFGIPDLLYTTVVSSLIALLIAVPVAIGVALFITQYAPRRLAKPVAYLIDLLASVPSIIYGLWGLAVLAPKLVPVGDVVSDVLGWIPLFEETGLSAGNVFVISVVLAIMILPIITAISREVFDQTPVTHKEGALALGATRWEMIRTAVLPFGRPGVISASMLGLGRALGETIAVTIILSAPNDNAPWESSVFGGGRTFASRIALGSSEFGEPSKTGAYIAAGLVLFILTFAVNATARVIINRRKEFVE